MRVLFTNLYTYYICTMTNTFWKRELRMWESKYYYNSGNADKSTSWCNTEIISVISLFDFFFFFNKIYRNYLLILRCNRCFAEYAENKVYSPTYRRIPRKLKLCTSFSAAFKCVLYFRLEYLYTMVTIRCDYDSCENAVCGMQISFFRLNAEAMKTQIFKLLFFFCLHRQRKTLRAYHIKCNNYNNFR